MEEQQFIDIMEIMMFNKQHIFEKRHDQYSKFMICTEMVRNASKISNGCVIPKCIEIKPSNIHGNGVFATKDIEENKVITMFPCHVIQTNDKSYTLNPFYREQLLANNISDISSYTFNIDETTSIFGVPVVLDYFFLGHMINDSYPTVDDFLKIKTAIDYGKTAYKYMLIGQQQNNCKFIKMPNYVYVKTTKNISAGEELTISYGFPFWSKHLNLSQCELFLSEYLPSLTPNQRAHFGELFKDSNVDFTEMSPSTNTIYLMKKFKDDPDGLIHAIMSATNKLTSAHKIN